MRTLKCFDKAHELKMQMTDEILWSMGLYQREALNSTVCNAFIWKPKGSKPDEYPNKPFYQQHKEMVGDVTKDEKELALEKWLAEQDAMRMNFKARKLMAQKNEVKIDGE